MLEQYGLQYDPPSTTAAPAGRGIMEKDDFRTSLVWGRTCSVVYAGATFVGAEQARMPTSSERRCW